MLQLKAFNSLLAQLKCKIFRFIDPLSLNYKLSSERGPRNNQDNENEVLPGFTSTTFNPKSKNLVIKDWRETKKVEKEVNGIKVVSTIPLPRNDENLDSREEGELVYSLLDIAKGGYFTKFLEKF